MRIILASHNTGKIKEIRNILATPLEIITLQELNVIDDIVEYGHTFHINALIKAQTISKKYPNDIIISDDSGLCIKQLNGAPGIYSARYAKNELDYNKKDFIANNRLVLKNMNNIFDREAYFMTVICIIKPSMEPVFFTGTLPGKIANAICPTIGFGYDVIFLYKGKYLSTYSENEKNSISHRKQAFDKLKKSKLLDF